MSQQGETLGRKQTKAEKASAKVEAARAGEALLAKAAADDAKRRAQILLRAKIAAVSALKERRKASLKGSYRSTL